MRTEFVNFFLGTRKLNPEMILSLLQSHPFIFFLQQSVHKVLCEIVVLTPNFNVELYLSFDDIIDGVRMILRLKGSFSSDKFVNDDSECPEVNSLIITSS